MRHKFRIPFDWLMVIALVCFLNLFLQLILPRLLSSFYATYIITPLLWGAFAYFIWRLPRFKAAGKARMRPLLIKLALATACFQIYLMVIAGFLSGFGKSPNSFTLKGIIINLIFAGASLLGTELSRAWLINRLLRRPATFLPLIIALLYTFINIPLKQFSALTHSLEGFTQFMGSTFLPVFMEHLLASFLAMWGGFLPALAYRGVLDVFEWFCPVLPDLNWAMKALTGVVVPITALTMIHDYYSCKLAPGKVRNKDKGMAGNVILSVAAVIFIWFSLGVFPVKPVIIYSGSMRPTFEVGDIVIIAKKNPQSLKTGEIISFHVPDSSIPTIHRINDIKFQEKERFFVTKGDNNRLPDHDPVQEKQVAGKVVLTIPRIGWASIFIKQFFS